MCVTLEGLWLVSDRIVDFLFLTKVHWSRRAKKLLIQQKTSLTWYVSHWKNYGWLLIELSIFDFSSNLTGPDLQYLSASELSQSMLVIHQKHPNQAKDLINMVCVTLEELWMVSDRIVDFRFLVFRQISQIQTLNNFLFLNYHRAC